MDTGYILQFNAIMLAMPFNKLLFFILFAITAVRLNAERTVYPTIYTAAGLNDFLADAKRDEHAAFSITGIVQYVAPANNDWFCIQDSSARVMLARSPKIQCIKPGDRVSVSGSASTGRHGEPYPYADKLSILGHGPTEPILKVRLGELDETVHNLALIQAEGTVIETFDDEVDEHNCFLLLKDGENTILLAVSTDQVPVKRTELIDATVRIRGIFTRSTHGIRKFSTPVIVVSCDGGIEIVQPPPENPFDVPDLEPQLYLSPRRIASMGRRKVQGEVIATWGGGQLLVRETSGRVVKIELAEDSTLPHCGDTCQFVGYPQTDLYRINLNRALYRPVDGLKIQPEHPERISTRQIIANSWHRPALSELYHGHLIRVSGIVRSRPNENSRDQLLILDDDGVQVAVDVSSNPAIAQMVPLDSIVAITGVCLLVTENRHAGNPFPQIKGFVLIPRGPDDVEIIKRPPWWTTGRLFAVLGVILALLGGIVIWNVMLRRMVERRSRELDRERHAHEQTEARAADRNRLAIELHDLISQSLTGATMQIESVGDIFALDQKKALRTLDIAARTLKSCKQELRNCIWDLRNNALDERHFTRAIRKSLELHSGDAEIRIQCDVLRSKLSDNTAHAILCIIRELVANAIHHGKAKSIEIVGTVQGDDLSFSVTDDGCGFDTARRPGIAEGHFGLQGIEERLDKLNGQMTIQSKINEGTSVSIWIKSEC